MAPNLALQNGWRHQAAHLTFTHTALGMAAVTLAGKARRRPKQITRHPGIFGSELEEDGFETNQIDVAAELELTRTRSVALEQQVARKTAAARIQNEHIKSLAAEIATANERIAELEDELNLAREDRAHWENENRSLQASLDLRRGESAAANERLAELEAELGSAREGLAHWENENRSLQASLDLSLGGNSRLAQRLRESNAAVDKASSQLAQLTTALTTVVAERNDFAAVVNKANETHQTEARALNANLTAATKRAVGAEKLLAEIRHSLLENVELLQNSLRGKERQIREFKQVRSKLVEGSRTLLQTLKARETALARAEQRIESLAEQVAELKAEASLPKNQERIAELNFQRQCERTEWFPAREVHDNAVTSCSQLEHELDFDGKQSSQSSNRPQARFIETLLAGTIAF